MYNIGIALSRGQIVCIADSDGIVAPTFVDSIIKAFEAECNIVLHMDQVRNNDKRFYPFNFPTIEEVLGEGCSNWKEGKTTGLWDEEDPLHSRNYGACMCATRQNLIDIGGADEHKDYLGHVCGPYETTFRLVNSGKREVWDQHEFMYHVWHPGTDGIDNYIGPHDGRHMSTTAIEVRNSGRVKPLLENQAIRLLRKDKEVDKEKLLENLIRPEYVEQWSFKTLESSKSFYKMLDHSTWRKHVKSDRAGYDDPSDNVVQRSKDSGAEGAAESNGPIDEVWRRSGPPILMDSFLGHNFVYFKENIYCVPQSLGPVDLSDQNQRSHPMIFVVDSPAKGKLKVLSTWLGRANRKILRRNA
jgi:hypothetical protein